jgi:P4 family phage/plasmid primase-like protien
MSGPSVPSVQRWNRALLRDGVRLAWLEAERGLYRETVERARLGWDADAKRYTIPIFADDALVNVRRYRRGAQNKAPKVINLAGCGSPIRLYSPFAAHADSEAVLVVEGEFDALLTGQEFLEDGLAVEVVSGTGGAENPPANLERLRNRDVYIAYDCDDAGRSGAVKLAERLAGVAASVRVVDLDLPANGADATDWFMTYGRTADQLWALCLQATPWEPETPAERRDADDLLSLAVQRRCAETGSRNAAGFWLACQLRDERYTDAEAEPVMRRFQEAVAEVKPDPYRVDEAMDSLRSAYARPPRDAVGGAASAYGWDDIGNDERLVDRHGNDMRYIAAYKGWHVWDGRRWCRDETGAVERWAKQTARAIRSEAYDLRETDEKRGDQLLAFAARTASRARITAMLDSARSEPDITVPASAFDRDPRLLACRNKVVVLGEDRATSREHRRDDYARLMARVDYQADVTADRWNTFLAYALPDADVRRYLQKLAGYSLVGGNPERRLIFLQGPTSTGKSTFMETLAYVLGEYAGTFDLSMFRAKQDESPRADIVDAISKRLVFTSEAVHEWRLHADVIKRMTGDDTIKARLPHSGSFIEKVPEFTPWIATNATPEIPNADRALWRRLVVVPFLRPAATEDKTLKRTLQSEGAEGVLAWAVEGWNLYCREGLDDPPTAVVEATMQQREALSHIDVFLTECCAQAAEYWTSSEALWTAYQAWCEMSSVHQRDRLAKNQLGEALKGRGYEDARRRVGDRSDDRKVRGWAGLRLEKGWERAHG